MNIEKALRNYLKGVGPKLKYDMFCSQAKKDPNASVNVLFTLINEEIDSMTDEKELSKTIELLNYIMILSTNFETINRKIVNRKLHKLYEKLDRVELEKENYFQNLKHVKNEFNKLRTKIENLQNLNIEKETKQYDFIIYLVNVSKNISYLELAFEKMPALVNVKDKNDTPLFRNIITRYQESLIENNIEDILYYDNLLSLIISIKSFELPKHEKRKCLDDIYKCINQLSTTKKEVKKNKNKIMKLEKLIDKIKCLEEKKKDISEIAKKYNIKIYFDDDLIEQAKLIKAPKEGETSDRVVIDDYIITIDNPNTVEIDDGLSCIKLENGNYLLGVHVASVLGYLPYESNIVQEAINRNQSIYFRTKFKINEDQSSKTLPIFPYDFSADTASLLEGKPRYARSYYFEIDKNGKIVNEEFYKSIITNQKKTSYEEVDEVLKNGCSNKCLEETVNNLHEVTEILDKVYQTSYLYEKIKENTEDISELKVKKIGAGKMVNLAMLLTGNRVAEFFARNNYPCIYRVHEVNEENAKKIENMVENLTATYGGAQFEKLYHLIEGIYPKGWYATEGPHLGLGLKHYCHCTSELRRASDIIVEHALEVCYDKTPTEKELQELKEEIAKKVTEINSRQKPIEWFTKDYQKIRKR